MSLIKPTIIESLFYQFFKLDSDRPNYYNNLYNIGMTIFKNLGQEDDILIVNYFIKENIEYKYKTDYNTLVHVFDNASMSMNKGAYVKMGNGLETRNISVFEIKRSLEEVKELIQNKIIIISRDIRFTRPTDIYS